MSPHSSLPSSGRLVFADTDLVIDFGQRLLLVGGVAAPLGGRSFDVLSALAAPAGALMTKDDLLARVWTGVTVDEAALRVHISAIRKALGDCRRLLNTTSGRGYRLLGDWAWATSTPTTTPDSGVIVRSNQAGGAFTLIGRDPDILKIESLLAAHRLVTLTGVGGIGKTSLARVLAQRAQVKFQEHVRFIDLSPISDPRLTCSTLTGILGLQLGGAEASPEAVARALGEQYLFIVLDNCEHLISAVAEACQAIWRLCPSVTLVCTSRDVLRVRGEQVYRVPALEVPAVGELNSANIVRCGAGELFVTRAQPLDRDFDLTPRDAAAVVAICRRLDGIPLAIEIAAARAATTGCAEVASLLDDRFSQLAGGRRTTLPRHQTLHATLEWSYGLLNEREKRVFRRLSRFSSAFDSSWAEQVASGDDLQRLEISDLLPELVMKSLVSVDSAALEPRYRLLETTRAFGLERLKAGGDYAITARKHAELVRDEMSGAEHDTETLDEDKWLDRYGRYLDDIRTALNWALDAGGDAELAASLTASALPLWARLSLLNECSQRIGDVLDKRSDGDQGGAREMKLLTTLASILADTAGGGPLAVKAATEALQIAEGLGDIDYQLRALLSLWNSCFYSGEMLKSGTIAAEFQRLAAMSSDPADSLLGHRLRGTTQFALGEIGEGRANLARTVSGYPLLPRNSNIARFGVGQLEAARAILTLAQLFQGALDQAEQMAELCFTEAIASGNALTICSIVCTTCTTTALFTGNERALERYVSAGVDYAKRFGLSYWLEMAEAFGALLKIRRGDVTAGLRGLAGLMGGDIDKGNARYLAVFCGYAETLGRVGNAPAGLALINACIARIEESSQFWFLPEAERSKAVLLAMEDVSRLEAESLFRSALERAERHGAHLLQLRIATSLAELLKGQGRDREAHAILQLILTRFTEGQATKVVGKARNLLNGSGRVIDLKAAG